MSTTLRVVLDQLAAPVPGGIGRYAEELTRQLIATAPRDCQVEGIMPAASDAVFARIDERLPGLTRVERLPMSHRMLTLAWQHNIRTSVTGMVHAPSVLAPLRSHRRRDGNQVVSTIHDTVPWTNPSALTPHGVRWHKAMAKRAQRFADAIVVPTFAVASELEQILKVGDRLRVIGGAGSSRLVAPADADARAAELDLPDRYLLAVGTVEPRKGLEPLITALADPRLGDIPLLVVGPAGWGDVSIDSVVAKAGLAAGRVRPLGFISDSDLALVLSRATAFVYPSLAEGFGLPLVEAFLFGTPVIHSDAPALVEVAGDAGVCVAREPAAGYPARLAEAIDSVLSEPARADLLRVRSSDRSSAFSWRDSAEKVWSLHADL